ncbi:AmmeMemoRadiSam system protein A [bacterium]|nr:AmmeMemoRadiSam system protein A [bacterium]
MFDLVCQRALVEISQAAIEASVYDRSGYDLPLIEDAIERNPSIGEAHPAFSTIYVADNLRGCLGEIIADDPVARVVARCSWRASRLDPRFDPVSPDELRDLRFNLSIMTPMTLVGSPDSIVIGRDGLMIEHGRCRGLLLPDVASEHDWDVPTFLKHLYVKAGIDRSVPLAETRLWSFQTQIIDSRDFRQ